MGESAGLDDARAGAGDFGCVGAVPVAEALAVARRLAEPTPSQLDESGRGFYVDGEGAREALRRRRQFNVIETNLACKIDLIIRRDRSFSREEIARRLRADLGGRSVAIVTPEDSVLSKLE